MPPPLTRVGRMLLKSQALQGAQGGGGQDGNPVGGPGGGPGGNPADDGREPQNEDPSREDFEGAREAIEARYLRALSTVSADDARAAAATDRASTLRSIMNMAYAKAKKSEFDGAIKVLVKLEEAIRKIEEEGERQPEQPEQNAKRVDASLLPASVKKAISDAKTGNTGDTREARLKASLEKMVERESRLGKEGVKWTDPLETEPKITQLREQRVSTKRELAKLLRTPDAPEEDIKRLFEKMETLDQALAQLNIKTTRKSLSPENLQADKDKNVYYANTAEERAQSQVHVNAEGLLVDAAGQVLRDGKHGYVESAADGSRHIFDSVKARNEKDQGLHHSSEVAGGDVTAAGEQDVRNGVITEVNDKSGHYRPDAQMIHQYIEGLIADGAKMHDESLAAWGSDGKPRSANDEEIKAYRQVQSLPALHKEVARLQSSQQPNDVETLNQLKPRIEQLEVLEQKLRKDGVGPANKAAAVQLYKASSLFNEAEWEQVKGDRSKIEKQIVEKLGMKLDGMAGFPSTSASTGTALDVNSMEKTNAHIGTLMRVADFAGNEHLVDKDVAYIRPSVDQFVQTGGNVKAMQGKKDLQAELAASGQTTLAREIEALGGAKRLDELGFEPAKLTPQMQLSLLEIPQLTEGSGVVLKSLGIENPLEHDIDTVIALLQSAHVLKEIGIDDPAAVTDDPKELLAIIQISKSFTNRKRPKEVVEASGSPEYVLEDLRDALKEERSAEAAAVQEIEDAETLRTGQETFCRLVGDATAFSRQQQLAILNRANDFEGLNGPETLKRFGVTEPGNFSVQELLLYLQSAAKVGSRGLADLQDMVGDISKFSPQKQLDFLARADEFEGLEGPAALKRFGVTDPQNLSVNAVLAFLKTARQIGAFGQAEETVLRLQPKLKFTRENADKILSVLQDNEKFEGEMAEARKMASALGADPDALSDDALKDIRKHFDAIEKLGGCKKLELLGIDLANTSPKDAIKQLELFDAGGAKKLEELGFDTQTLGLETSLNILKMDRDLAEYGGVRRLTQLVYEVRWMSLKEAEEVLKAAAELAQTYEIDAADHKGKVPQVLKNKQNNRDASDDGLSGYSF